MQSNNFALVQHFQKTEDKKQESYKGTEFNNKNTKLINAHDTKRQRELIEQKQMNHSIFYILLYV